jgi:hypothetical protein
MTAERAAGWVRRWVALYTRGLPAEIRQDRRDEIDDDLWCQLRDAGAPARGESLTGEIVARLLLGMPADVSWRLEQRHGARKYPAPERHPTKGTGAIAVMAIVGGIGWAIFPIPIGLVGGVSAPGAAVSWFVFFSVVVGTWVLTGATFGLVTEFQDRIRGIAALLGTLGALIGSISFLGMFGAIVALPIGTAALVWDLGRGGVLGSQLSRAHVAAAIIALTLIVLLFASPTLLDDPATAVPVMMLMLPYAFSWISIGWSLRHGAPVPEKPAGSAP